MFKEKANIAFNNSMFNCTMISVMHEQMRRLYEAAYKIKKAEGQSEVARLLNSSPQALNNWEKRGISADGLLSAQKFIGCDALWLRDGVGEMTRNPNALEALSPEARLLDLYEKSTDSGRELILRAAKNAEKRLGNFDAGLGRKDQP